MVPHSYMKDFSPRFLTVVRPKRFCKNDIDHIFTTRGEYCIKNDQKTNQLNKNIKKIG